MTDRHAQRQKEARRILDRVASDSETVGSSTLARTATRLSNHFMADGDADDDRIEILGKRIGRALGLIAFVVLAIYLFLTYVVTR
jgi:hypothetical protein